MQRRNRRATRRRFQAMRIRATCQRLGYPISRRAVGCLVKALEMIAAPEVREERMFLLTAVQLLLEERLRALEGEHPPPA